MDLKPYNLNINEDYVSPMRLRSKRQVERSKVKRNNNNLCKDKCSILNKNLSNNESDNETEEACSQSKISKDRLKLIFGGYDFVYEKQYICESLVNKIKEKATTSENPRNIISSCLMDLPLESAHELSNFRNLNQKIA
ncbi:unnamed protein product [Brachionus calyciflorus]|uniref:Uncharacterized protein n=1 Tax=Brachionus calyciflorus TaxID=104777 RepID=A0A814B0K3_9BILA|nr:unnamed protein product [Brachionus calyciflorus]